MLTVDMADVLVIGAGPTGLMMAAELVRQGMTCRIIDKETGPSVSSKALGIQARTLEIFEHLGIVEEFLAQGLAMTALNTISRGKRLTRIDFSGLDSPYPFILSLEQSKTEEILIRYLASFGVRVERETELCQISETEKGIETIIRNRESRQEQCLTSWAIGCDGAHSTVRKQLGFSFEGKAFSEIFSIADIALDNWPYPHCEASLFFDEQGLFGALSLPGCNRYRLLFQLARCQNRLHASKIIHGPIKSEQLPDPTLDEVQEVVDRYVASAVRVHSPLWLSNFHIHSRLIQTFRRGKIMLAGDAAHIHSPAGAQGMNTGIQDAFNLAWKLALVHRGKARIDLLDTYNLERRYVAKRLLKATALATHIGTLRNPIAISLRNWIVALLTSIPQFRKQLIRTISQIAIQYPKSSLVIESPSFASGPKAGTRFPNAICWHANGSTDLSTLLRKSLSHHLLLFTGPKPTIKRIEALVQLGKVIAIPVELILIVQSSEGIAKLASRAKFSDFFAGSIFCKVTYPVGHRHFAKNRIQRKKRKFGFEWSFAIPSSDVLYSAQPETWNIRYNVVSDPDGAVHARFGATREAAYLIRPDCIIGCRCSPIDEEKLKSYLLY